MHLLTEHRINRFELDCGDRKLEGEPVYEVKIHYVAQFNKFAKDLGQKTKRDEVNAGVRLEFPYKGWTIYTILETPMTDSQRLFIG